MTDILALDPLQKEDTLQILLDSLQASPQRLWNKPTPKCGPCHNIICITGVPKRPNRKVVYERFNVQAFLLSSDGANPHIQASPTSSQDNLQVAQRITKPNGEHERQRTQRDIRRRPHPPIPATGNTIHLILRRAHRNRLSLQRREVIVPEP